MDFAESTIKTYSGLSSETKPTIAGGTDVPNGSRWREVGPNGIDTGKIYYFNLADDAWYLVPEKVVLYDPINDRQLELEINGGVPVNLQDQTTPTIILPMAQQLAVDTLASDAVINAYTVALNDATGFAVGQHFRIINSAADRFYFGTILGIAVNAVTVDTQMDFAYLAGSQVTGSNINMNVNGSVTPIVFTLRTGSPSIPSVADITRMIITCTATSAVSLNLFGNLAALTRGLAFRRVNDIQSNTFNVKTNKDIAGIAFDWTPYEAINPAQGVDGFVSRLTFAGQNKIGVTLRVGQTDNLEMLVQDDLRLLTSLTVNLEGHIVQN